MSYIFNSTVLSTPSNTDAFGRARVSQPFTLGDYNHIYGLNPNFIDMVSNGGAVTFQANQACARLSTTSNSASSAIHQTAMYHHYMPGKSQLIMSTFNFYAAVPNVTKRTGYFDANNGIFFEQTGDGTLSLVLRSSVSGFPVETRVAQSSWNVDKCNGTGASGYNLDITKTQLFFIDFQWLGVGRIRMGFSHDGKDIVAHEMNGTNNLTTVYMATPNLPIRCEISNTGATTGGYFDQICSTVVSEGGYVEAGQDWSITSPTLRNLTSGTSVPVMAIRLKTAFNGYANRMFARIDKINVFSSGENVKWTLVRAPNQAALTGSTWTSVNSSSGVEYNSTATAVTSYDEMDNGYVSSAGNGVNAPGGAPTASASPAAKKNYISQNYASTDSQIFVVYVTNIGTATASVGVGIQWREVY